MKISHRIKTTISVLLTVIMVMSAVSVMPTANAAGTTYNVSDAAQLEAACGEINTNGGEATISLTADISGAVAINIENSSAVVTVVGNGHTLTSTDSAIKVDNGATVNLGDGSSALTLSANDNNDVAGVVYVLNNSVCNMYDGVTIKDHKGQNYLGGGVTVEGSLFHMYGGTITNCGIYSGSTCYGGGVSVYNGGEFIMDSGTISKCYATTEYIDTDIPNCVSGVGGGVFVTDGSTFIMNGGTISECSATNFGGGVAMTLSDIESKKDPDTGQVIINPDTGKGYVDLGNPRSKVSINSGTISKNQAKSGAGVFASGYYFAFAAIFREDPLGVGTPDNPGMYINGGVNKDVDISSNKATEMGGGVLYAGLKDTVKAQIYNANISDNTAASGAGVMNYKYWTQLDIDGCII